MADKKRTIEIIVSAVDDVSARLDTIGKGVERFGDGVSGLSSGIGDFTAPLANVADTIVGIDAALAGLGAALIGFSVNEAGKFGDSVNEINTLLDISPQKFGDFSDSILDYSRDSVRSIDQINASVYAAISAGRDYEQSLGSLTQAEQLSVAGKADLESTLVLLASSLNAYGKSTESAAEFSDYLFQTVKLGQTTLPELAQSLAQVTSIAASSGIPFSTLTAAIADLTAKGLPTSQAITGIKSALSNIIKPSKAAKDEAAALGVQFDIQALKTKGLDGLLRDLSEATGGNVTQMGKFFGSVEGLNAALSLSSDGAAGFTDKLDQMRNSTGSTAEAYEKMADNMAFVNQNLVNNMTATLIEIGGRLLDEYTDVAKALGRVFAGISVGIDAGAFDPVFDSLEDFGTNIAAFLNQLADNLPAALDQIDWSGFTESLEEFAGAIAELFDGVDVSTPAGLAKAIQSVVETGESLIDVSTGIVQGFKPFIDALVKAVEEFNALEDGTKLTIGNVLGVGSAINKVIPALDALGGGLSAVGSGLSVIGGASIIKAFTSLEGVSAALGGTFLKTGAAATGAAAGLSGAAASMAGPGGLVALAGASGYSLGTLANAATKFATDRSISTWVVDGVFALEDWIGHTKEAEGSLRNLSGTAQTFAGTGDDIVQWARDFGKGAKDSALSAEEINAALNVTGSLLVDMQGNLVSFSSGMEQSGKSAEQAAQAIGYWTDAAGNVQTVTGESLDEVNAKIDEAKHKAEGWLEIVEGGESIWINVGKSAAEGLSKADEKLTGTVQLTEQLYLDLEKLASDERIKNIEIHADINIAQVKADADKFIAVVDNMGTAIQATSDTLGGLFGLFAQADNLREAFQIENWIEEQLDIQRMQVESLIKTNEAQIALMESQARRLDAADPVITINGDGLAPHLEAFMFEVLEAVQVKVNEKYGEFLLGCGGSGVAAT